MRSRWTTPPCLKACACLVETGLRGRAELQAGLTASGLLVYRHAEQFERRPGRKTEAPPKRGP
jgi:hypothetical protein